MASLKGHPLTTRESQIVLLLVDGATWSDIRAITNMSHSTLKNHITTIGYKWSVSGRSGIVFEGWKRGLGQTLN